MEKNLFLKKYNSTWVIASSYSTTSNNHNNGCWRFCFTSIYGIEKAPPLTQWGEVARAKRATEGRKRIPWENLQIAYNLINLPRSISNGNSSTTYYGYLSDGTKSLVTRQTWQRLVTRSTDEVCTAWVAIRQGCQIHLLLDSLDSNWSRVVQTKFVPCGSR